MQHEGATSLKNARGSTASKGRLLLRRRRAAADREEEGEWRGAPSAVALLFRKCLVELRDSTMKRKEGERAQGVREPAFGNASGEF